MPQAGHITPAGYAKYNNAENPRTRAAGALTREPDLVLPAGAAGMSNGRQPVGGVLEVAIAAHRHAAAVGGPGFAASADGAEIDPGRGARDRRAGEGVGRGGGGRVGAAQRAARAGGRAPRTAGDRRRAGEQTGRTLPQGLPPPPLPPPR